MNVNNKIGISFGLWKGRILDEFFNCNIVIVVIRVFNKEGKRWFRTKLECINYSLFL